MTLGTNLGVLQTTKTMTMTTDARVYFASLFFNSCSLTPATRRRLLAAAAAEDALPHDIVLEPPFLRPPRSLDFCFSHRALTDVDEVVPAGGLSRVLSRDCKKV